MNSAVVVAAGSGTRFGSAVPKQFLELAGKPLIIHTLERFERCPVIDEIILVLPAADIERFKPLAGKFTLKKLAQTVAGGPTRAASVFNGFSAVTARNDDIVAIHDGARPLVSLDEITLVVEQARAAGAACLVAPVTDTIKEVKDGIIAGTIDRRRLRRALTPQCFRFEVLRQAFAGAELSEAVTDECFLVEQTGQKIRAVEGSARNIKITTPEDFRTAEEFLKIKD